MTGALPMPGVFRSTKQAMTFYWRVMSSRAVPHAMDPSRQLIQGSSDGYVKINGEYHELETVLGVIGSCLGRFSADEQRILAWGYALQSGGDIPWEQEGYDTRGWGERFRGIAQDMADRLRHAGMLQPRE